jgi:hypothetical protein
MGYYKRKKPAAQLIVIYSPRLRLAARRKVLRLPLILVTVANDPGASAQRSVAKSEKGKSALPEENRVGTAQQRRSAAADAVGRAQLTALRGILKRKSKYA